MCKSNKSVSLSAFNIVFWVSGTFLRETEPKVDDLQNTPKCEYPHSIKFCQYILL